MSRALYAVRQIQLFFFCWPACYNLNRTGYCPALLLASERIDVQAPTRSLTQRPALGGRHKKAERQCANIVTAKLKAGNILSRLLPGPDVDSVR